MKQNGRINFKCLLDQEFFKIISKRLNPHISIQGENNHFTIFNYSATSEFDEVAQSDLKYITELFFKFYFSYNLDPGYNKDYLRATAALLDFSKDEDSEGIHGIGYGTFYVPTMQSYTYKYTFYYSIPKNYINIVFYFCRKD